jgi:hypothetical protein
MKKNKWMYFPLLLLLAILACTSRVPTEPPKIAGTVSVQRSTPISQEEAISAIHAYAKDVLGLDIEDLKATGRSGEITFPMSTKEGVDTAVDLAGTTFFGFWDDGITSLSIGDSTVSGDLEADIEDGSLGTFWLWVDQPYPGVESEALSMVLETFPGLSGIDFIKTEREGIDTQGFEFMSKQTDEVRLQNWGVTLTGTTFRIGVRPGIRQGRSIIWAVVASGALASPFLQP